MEQDNRKYPKYKESDTIGTLAPRDTSMSNSEYKKKKRQTYLEIQGDIDKLALKVGRGRDLEMEDVDALLVATNILGKLFVDIKRGKKRTAVDKKELKKDFKTKAPIENPQLGGCQTTTTVGKSEIETEEMITTLEHAPESQLTTVRAQTVGIELNTIEEGEETITFEEPKEVKEGEFLPPEDDTTLLENICLKYMREEEPSYKENIT